MSVVEEDRSRVSSTTPVMHPKKKPLLRVPLWLYFTIASLVATIIATAINVGVAYAMYPPETAAKTSVWAWPSTICGDLVITAGASFLVTWMLSPTMALNDFIVRFPIETKPCSFPKVTRKLHPWLMINPLFGNDLENPMPKCTALGRQIRMGVIGGLTLAGTWGIILSLFMMIHPLPWTQSDLALLKGTYGAVTEIICVVFALGVLVVQVSPRMNSEASASSSAAAEARAGSTSPADRV
ncbi:hypothetical protein FOL47_007630 [Perkinsus chesapeaki]|uniref:Uncharacterized protein n=1 Tax=Perkinsus chesapeaki TaxID=330153 RepID=A0A7J6LJH7_PERCH|nr:hypothetical protein FOL47_007630 [Perkinsus chesapeaki]